MNGIGNFKVYAHRVTPALDTNETAAGDVLCATVPVGQPLPKPFRGELVGLTVLDKAGNGAELDVVLLKSAVDLGSPGSAVSISDANAEEILRVQNVSTIDYVDLVGSQFADVTCGKTLEISGTVEVTSYLYLALIDRTGGNTYAANSLVVTLYVRADNPR